MPANSNEAIAASIRVTDVGHTYGAVTALDGVSLELAAGSDTAIIGPDGVGKSTLLGLIAGARIIQAGRVDVLGGDMADAKHRTRVAPRIAFMPQGLGRNLYPSLSVAENIEFFACLYATAPQARQQRRDDLLRATGLDPFAERAAGKLSGGMRQKLSLCCALVHDPDLLILDEPTTGIDPLSRRQFWQLIDAIRAGQPRLTLVVATAYMEEAARFSRIVAMDGGRILASGTAAELMAATGKQSLEQAYVGLHHRADPSSATAGKLVIPPRVAFDGEAIVAQDLTRRFGDFTAVDGVSFRIERGEIFGFLGSNGCGKTTTMKMLTGLLPATSGRAWLLGKPVNARDLETRRRVGYMSQSFSLYGELTVRANLELHARLYRIGETERVTRIEETLSSSISSRSPAAIPARYRWGIRQRLQLAVACLHRPEILILDEPTSGVDPETRDRFWLHLAELSRQDGVTIFISTHFMNEAERCDRVSFMHAGKVLAVGTPNEITTSHGASTLEQAFIGCLEAYAGGAQGPRTAAAPQIIAGMTALNEPQQTGRWRSWRTWVQAFGMREAREVLRDPIRLSFALLGPLVLMMTFARGISFDIEALPFAVLDRDRSAESQSLTLHLAGSRYFSQRAAVSTDAEADLRLQSGAAALVVEIPAGFGRDLLRGHQPALSLWLDGANPARANTARGYAEGITQSFIASLVRTESSADAAPRVDLQPRFFYNQEFRSVFAMTPGVIMFLSLMITAMMTALGVVREREIGSIVNFAVSPATTSSFLIGKLLPYIAIGCVTLLSMVCLAVFWLGLALKGSVAALAIGGILYVGCATTFGIFVSTFARTQVAAIFACAILTLMPALNFSGFLQPISNLSEQARIIGLGFPSSWFQQISSGVFTKGLPFWSFLTALEALAIFPFIFLAAASFLLQKQER